MNGITDQHVDYIYADLKSRGMTMKILTDEFVDHICCLLEPEMFHGKSFQVAYNEFIINTKSETFLHVQHQTLLSTNLKFQKMKKTMFSFGTVGTLLMALGAFFKMMHWPGAGVGLFLGVVFILLGFMPLFFYTLYKEQAEKKNIWLSVVGYLTLAFLIAGPLFKVMHWPGAKIILHSAQILLIVGFLPLYLVNVFKKANETKVNLIYLIFIVAIGLSTLFMSSSLTMSKDMIDKYDVLYKEQIKVCDMFGKTNDTLILKLDAKYASGLVKEKINRLKAEEKQVQSLIENIKIEIKRIGKNSNSNEIDFNIRDNTEAFKEAMKKDGNAMKLKDSFESYRKYLLSISKNELQKQVINTYLDFAQIFGVVLYSQNYEGISIIEGFLILETMQKNAKLAEFEILNSMD